MFEDTGSPSAIPGTLHHIPPVTAFEPTPRTARSAAPNTLLWIGGLFDTYHTVHYPYALAESLPPNWALSAVNLTSAAHGWGTSSLDRDVAELAKVVEYFKTHRKGSKLVLMGHSTGCQDGMHYVGTAAVQGFAGSKAVDGVILQAPVSDREALVRDVPAEVYERANKLAAEWVSDGRAEDCLPLAVTQHFFDMCPVSARRWLSLASPDGKGQDDYFSSDLDEDELRKRFGCFPSSTPLLILHGGSDEFVPEDLDQSALSRKWMKYVRDGGGVVDESSDKPVEGATHNLNSSPNHVVDELCRRVINFVQSM